MLLGIFSFRFSVRFLAPSRTIVRAELEGEEVVGEVGKWRRVIWI